MKSILLFLTGLLFSTIIQSQVLFPSPQQNPFWFEEHGSLWSCGCGPCDGYYCTCQSPIYYSTDVTIDTTVYHQLVSRGICHAIYAGGMPPYGCSYSCNWLESESQFALIRIDPLNNRVYILENNIEYLLYDFGAMAIGQPYPSTINNLLGDSLRVVSVDTIALGTQNVRRWQLGISNSGTITDSGFVAIIEGIGSTYGLLATLVPPFENGDQLLCFSKNDSTMYPDNATICDKTVSLTNNKSEKKINISPNPARNTATISIDFECSNCTIAIISAEGELVFNDFFDGNQYQIDLQCFSTGLYFTTISSNRISVSSELMVY